MAEPKELTSAMQDYIRAIHELARTESPVTTTALAPRAVIRDAPFDTGPRMSQKTGGLANGATGSWRNINDAWRAPSRFSARKSMPACTLICCLV